MSAVQPWSGLAQPLPGGLVVLGAEAAALLLLHLRQLESLRRRELGRNGTVSRGLVGPLREVVDALQIAASPHLSLSNGGEGQAVPRESAREGQRDRSEGADQAVSAQTGSADDDLVGTKEAGRMLGVSARTIRRMVERGVLGGNGEPLSSRPGTGRSILLARSEVAAFAAQRRSEGRLA